jgi:hypothetical protein
MIAPAPPKAKQRTQAAEEGQSGEYGEKTGQQNISLTRLH